MGLPGILRIDVDAYNAEMFEAHRDWTPERALAWSERIHRDLLAALAALPVERLLGGRDPHGARRWCARAGMSHPREHREELERRFGNA